jgi:hypothetical protein
MRLRGSIETTIELLASSAIRRISAAKGNVGWKADVLHARYSFEAFNKSTLTWIAPLSDLGCSG